MGPDEAPRERPPEPPPETSDTAPVVDTGPTDTGPTDTATTPAFDCSAIPNEPLSVTPLEIVTTEDFDFDAEGRLVYADQFGGPLVGVTYDLDFTILAPSIHDARGISVLSDGRVLVAWYLSGVVSVLDPAVGANTTLISGLVMPNALEVGEGDLIYFTEAGNGRVRQFDISTGESTPVADGFSYPNGLVINETHDVLYVSDYTEGIFAVRKNDDGTWAEKELVYDPSSGLDTYDALEVDACGNLYVLGFTNGRLVRFDPDVKPLEPVVLAELNDPGAFLWNAMHWGSDRGGWRRDTLYVTDRNKVFGVELGVPGKAQPVDLAPLPTPTSP